MNFYGAQQEDEESEEIEIHLAHPKATIAETKKYIEQTYEEMNEGFND